MKEEKPNIQELNPPETHRSPVLDQIPFAHALIIFVLALSVIIFGLRLGAGMHLPLFLAIVVSCVGAALNKTPWKDIQSALFSGVLDGLPASCILLLIGMLTGLWAVGGAIPTLIYYGLGWLSPRYLAPTACVLCGLASIMTGTSFGTISTIGLALMGIGEAMGVHAPLLAGAIVSGAYFGDKMSPLSDTTNVAPAVSGSNIYDHIKSMLYTTLPALILSLVALTFLGQGTSPSITSHDTILQFKKTLMDTFNLGPVTLIPALTVLVLAVKQMPPIPALTASIGVSAVTALVTQKISLNAVAVSMASGYVSTSGNPLADTLLSRGGMTAMLPTILLILMATGLGGVLRESGIVSVLVKRLLAVVSTSQGLVLSVISSCFLVLLASGNQMLAIILPGQAFKQAFAARNIDPSVLSRTLEDAGTLGAALVPWSTAALFIQGMLQVSPAQYAPYAILNWLTPLIAIIYAGLGAFIFPAKRSIGKDSEPAFGIKDL